jgi:replicative DNA helicase
MNDPMMTPPPNPALLNDLAGELLAQEATAREAALTGKAPGPTTGIASLDEEIGGFLARGLHVLLAAPGAGKTSLALQIAGTCGCPCLYVTSEMPRVELLRRIIARTTGTYLSKLRGGKLGADDLGQHVRSAALACPMLALYDATRHAATIADIQDKAEALRARFEAPHVLIVVDSVTDWAQGAASAAGGDEARQSLTEYSIAEAALNGLKALTANVPGALLAIAHRNRAGQNAKGGDKLFSAKATGRYEYIAESVWDLDRDPTQEPVDNQSSAKLELLKNRHGAAGISIDLMFEGRLQQWREGGASGEIRALTAQHRASNGRGRNLL